MTKTPPEETRIVTRLARDRAKPLDPDASPEILEMISGALDEHAQWLRKWHRAVVCGLPPHRDVVSGDAWRTSRFGQWFDNNTAHGLLDQPVFQQLRADHIRMRDLGRRLAMKAAAGEALLSRDYDVFMEKSEAFVAKARRIREAFQRAVFDLDPLTGVHGRRGMMADLERERQRSLRTGKAMCIGLCDIDHFKAVNDQHGHLAGDSVLLAVAGRLIANLRPYDSIYRFGGEEFLLAFVEADAEQALGIAERLRKAICATDVIVEGGAKLRVSASFGLSMVDADMSLETTIQRADEALYSAKRGGRNRVAVWRQATENDNG